MIGSLLVRSSQSLYRAAIVPDPSSLPETWGFPIPANLHLSCNTSGCSAAIHERVLGGLSESQSSSSVIAKSSAEEFLGRLVDEVFENSELLLSHRLDK